MGHPCRQPSGGVTCGCRRGFVGTEHPVYDGTCGGDGIGTRMSPRSPFPARLCTGWRKGAKGCGGHAQAGAEYLQKPPFWRELGRKAEGS